MIEVNHLTKKYGNHTALSDLSFTIEKGQIYGFLGPNGAGKSTTMNIMTGCLAATSGEVKINGYDIYEEANEAKKLIGYLPELPPLYPDRTPREYLSFVARAKKIPASKLAEEISHVMEVTQITDVADRLIKNLSKGYRQRVGIAQAILGNPEIIILDEPTVGLDPKQIIEIRDLILELGKKHTVILSSHILSEVQAICQTILIISKGKLVACDTPKNLEKLFAGEAAIELTYEAPESGDVSADLENIISGIPVNPSEIEMHDDGYASVVLHTASPADNTLCRDIFFAFSNKKRAIVSMTTSKASLEDIFIELTGNVNSVEKENNKEADTDESSIEA